MKHNELPIFFDQSKWRWKIIRLFAAVLLLTLSGFLIWLVPNILEPVPLRPGQVTPSPLYGSVDTIAAEINTGNAPIIGEGPLARVIKVSAMGRSSVGVDPFTGELLRVLTTQDTLVINGHAYAIERFGETQGGRLVLTFDDGPDPHYTTKLLDLLSRESVPATFFVVGANIVQHPDIARRIVHEGHILGNHTITHADVDIAGGFRSEQEINQTERIIRATTNRSTSYFRPPYGAATNQGLRDGVTAILHAQRLGYVSTFYDYDTRDWEFTGGHMPELKKLDPKKDHVILLHDAGGDRTHTIEYVAQLIKEAKAAGYTFVTVEQIYPHAPLFMPVLPSFADNAALAIGSSMLVWPQQIILRLFALSVGLLLISTVLNVVLALIGKWRAKRVVWRRGYRPFVTIIVPAYNEGRVLAMTVRSLLQSHYRRLEVIIVDDGSTDDTLRVAQGFARRSKRVTVLRQKNKGKAVAVNRGIKRAKGEVVVCVDADTVFPPRTIGKLIRHFSNPTIGGVAGMVKVGNPTSVLARWQSLEYITGIHIERSAQSCIGAIMIVPGACGAWRREALLKVGGYSTSTLAEDCDLTLTIRRAGYGIVQDNEAVSYTECPLTLNDLAKQRFRWIFGNLQAFWKHRSMFFNRRYRWLGMFVLPHAALGVGLPLLFWPLLMVLTAQNIAAGHYMTLLFFLSLTILIHFIMAFIGLLIAKESMWHLTAVPLTRFVYGPLRTYLLYRSAMTALKGVAVGWNKLTRSGEVLQPRAMHRLLHGKSLFAAFYTRRPRH